MPADPAGLRAALLLPAPTGRRRLPPWPGRCLPVPPFFAASRRSLFRLAGQGRGGPGDLGLGDRILAAAGEHLPGVVPCLLAEGRRGSPQVCPRRQDPAAVAEVVTDPHARDVVRVEADFPEPVPGVHPGVLAPAGGERLAVVGAVADLDAVGVDLPPGRRQQLDVVAGGQRDRDVSRGLDQGGIHLVRGQFPAGHQRVEQPGVRPGLPRRDEPFVQKILKFRY